MDLAGCAPRSECLAPGLDQQVFGMMSYDIGILVMVERHVNMMSAARAGKFARDCGRLGQGRDCAPGTA